MVRTSTKENQITLKSVEKLLNNDEIADKVAFNYKKGKIMLSLTLRPAEQTSEKEDVEYDITEFTEADLKVLIDQYTAYITFDTKIVPVLMTVQKEGVGSEA